MNMELLMQLVTYALMAVGVLAFIVSAIVQVIKDLPGLQQIQTSVVVLAVSVILCPLAMIVVCQICMITILWYYWPATVIAAFVVYLVTTGGWERVTEMWQRTKYNKK